MKLNKFEIDNLIKDNILLKERVKELKTEKEALEKQFSLNGVVSSLISEEELNAMANDYVKLKCHKFDGFDIKAQRFQDYRNGLKNMHKVLK